MSSRCTSGSGASVPPSVCNMTFSETMERTQKIVIFPEDLAPTEDAAKGLAAYSKEVLRKITRTGDDETCFENSMKTYMDKVKSLRKRVPAANRPQEQQSRGEASQALRTPSETGLKSWIYRKNQSQRQNVRSHKALYRQFQTWAKAGQGNVKENKIYRVDPNGHWEWDSPPYEFEEDIEKLSLSDGSPPKSESSKAKSKSSKAKSVSSKAKSVSSKAKESSKEVANSGEIRTRKRQNKIYRVDPNGHWEWDSPPYEFEEDIEKLSLSDGSPPKSESSKVKSESSKAKSESSKAKESLKEVANSGEIRTRKRQNKIYRVDPNGHWEWDSPPYELEENIETLTLSDGPPPNSDSTKAKDGLNEVGNSNDKKT
ncbi:hypothetical protein EDC01DRAFT_746954 [Geopyxis carbonaria]|nr:hypothetical protein EDC01DRAFT_746954 [Geopyxis carbonaria]